MLGRATVVVVAVLASAARGLVGRREPAGALATVCGRARLCLDACRGRNGTCGCLPREPLRSAAAIAASAGAFRRFDNGSVVFQLHFRKASGTSIRQELKSAAAAVVRGGGRIPRPALN